MGNPRRRRDRRPPRRGRAGPDPDPARRGPGQGARGEHLEAFYGFIYYAATAPQKQSCWPNPTSPCRRGAGAGSTWPASAARAGRDWTDDGTAHQARGLKHRAPRESRSVPIPPVLVAMLRAHLQAYGTAADGRLFRTSRGGLIQDSAYSAVWQAARAAALTPAQHASPLARRPYDLRHAAVSLWLNAGVPATEVARRADHSVAVLLKVYAHCIADALGRADEPGT